MSNTFGSISFATVAQAALFELELKGQFSDGAWENARPGNHWECWCRAEVRVDPANVGVEGFFPRKTNYGLVKELVPVVGSRMITIAKLAIAVGEMHEDLHYFEYLFNDATGEWSGVPSWLTNADARKRYGAYDLDKLRAAVEAVTYTRKDLVRDLQAIKVAMNSRQSVRRAA